MLTRRHIRIKVLQSIYAFYQAKQDDLAAQEKFLRYSMDQILDLYVLMLQSLVATRDQAEAYRGKVQKKHLATDRDKNPSRNFIDNRIIAIIAGNPAFNEFLKNKKLDYWKSDDEYISLLFKDLREKVWYQEYLDKTDCSLSDDRKFILRFYREVIAPNEKLYEYLEDRRLTWLDDFPVVNTAVVRALEKLGPDDATHYLLPEVYKQAEDREYASTLLKKVILHDDALTDQIDAMTPNWDRDRIAEMDMIILKMGIAEFLYFPSIPVRATINEYLEIAKEYSTPKSSLFINGILDKLSREFQENGKLNKIGRGLR
jgi:N utilization substance protein B